MKWSWKNYALYKAFIAYHFTEWKETVDWSLNYYQQRASVTSSLIDFTMFVRISTSTRGWSKSRLLYNRLKRVHDGLPFQPQCTIGSQTSSRIFIANGNSIKGIESKSQCPFFVPLSIIGAGVAGNLRFALSALTACSLSHALTLSRPRSLHNEVLTNNNSITNRFRLPRSQPCPQMVRYN